ncbi:MAG: hypothetical protein M1819_007108 [Sarea resinae]|nr:MAG: hypothetical protein M1819_007108 [Sarea resinae]
MDSSTDFGPFDPYLTTRSTIAIVLPTLSILTLILSVPPLTWHIKHANIPASSLVCWILLLNFFNAVNAFIWPTDNITSWWSGIVLCDIEAKIMTASSAGMIGSLICIMRSLANVLNTDRTVLVPSRAARRRQMVLDVLCCFGLPVYLMAVHYVVQPNRYYITAIAGCGASLDSSWPTIVLVNIWPVLASLLCTYYCVVVIFRIHRYRSEFSHLLALSNTSRSRFLRLFLISTILCIVFLPLQLYVFYVNVNHPLERYSWSRVHSAEWSQIIMAPSFGTVRFDRWIYIASGMLVFVFFGVGREAVEMYRGWLVKMGLGTVLPTLTKPYQGRGLGGKSKEGSSFGSKAKLMLRRPFSWGGKKAFDLKSPISSSSTQTEIFTPSPSDPQKTFLATIPPHAPPSVSPVTSPSLPHPDRNRSWRRLSLLKRFPYPAFASSPSSSTTLGRDGPGSDEEKAHAPTQQGLKGVETTRHDLDPQGVATRVWCGSNGVDGEAAPRPSAGRESNDTFMDALRGRGRGRGREDNVCVRTEILRSSEGVGVALE